MLVRNQWCDLILRNHETTSLVARSQYFVHPKLPRLLRALVARPGNTSEIADEAIGNTFGNNFVLAAIIDDQSEPPFGQFV